MFTKRQPAILEKVSNVIYHQIYVRAAVLIGGKINQMRRHYKTQDLRQQT